MRRNKELERIGEMMIGIVDYWGWAYTGDLLFFLFLFGSNREI
jgi:hypothetical protein